MGPNMKQMNEIQYSIPELESQVFETERLPISIFEEFKASHMYPELMDIIWDLFLEYDAQQLVSCLIQASNDYFIETDYTEFSLITDKLGELIDESDYFFRIKL